MTGDNGESTQFNTLSPAVCGCCESVLREDEDYLADVRYGILCRECFETIEEVSYGQ